MLFGGVSDARFRRDIGTETVDLLKDRTEIRVHPAEAEVRTRPEPVERLRLMFVSVWGGEKGGDISNRRYFEVVPFHVLPPEHPGTPRRKLPGTVLRCLDSLPDRTAQDTVCPERPEKALRVPSDYPID